MKGDLVGHYRLGETLGHGGLSTVYSAVDTITGQRVAIKIAGIPEDPAARAASADLFLQEVSVVAQLKHSSVASIVDQGTTTDGAPYFVMELLEGRSLQDVLSKNTCLSVPIAVSIASQVASALGAAHALGFIHRDVKPANIFVMDESKPDSWTIKLLDFGVAAQLNDATGLTRGGGLFGSVYYMSPEQIIGKPLSPRSDIWQLGVLLFQMLSGSLPFDSDDSFGAMKAIMTAEVAIPDSLSIPASLRAFISRCLSKNPEDRPRDGQEAARILQALELDSVPDIVLCSPAAPARASLPGAFPASEKVASAPGASGSLASAPLLVSGIAFLVFGAWAIHVRFHPTLYSFPWMGIVAGIGLALSGALFGRTLARVLTAKHKGLSSEAHNVLAGARSRDQLSRTLAIQVDDIAARCRLVDEKFLAMTMAVMVDEFGAATTSDDRQKSLMNAVTILEKLTVKLTPWYVRQEKLITLCVTLVGLFSGLIAILQNVVKLIKKG